MIKLLSKSLWYCVRTVLPRNYALIKQFDPLFGSCNRLLDRKLRVFARLENKRNTPVHRRLYTQILAHTEIFG